MQMTITNRNQNQARSCNAMWKMRTNAYDDPGDWADKERKGGMQFLEQEEKKWLVSTPVLRTEAECKAV
jgi:hypothetical protein